MKIDREREKGVRGTVLSPPPWEALNMSPEHLAKWEEKRNLMYRLFDFDISEEECGRLIQKMWE